MKKYIVVTKRMNEHSRPFYEDQFDAKQDAKIYSSFDDAYQAMRETIVDCAINAGIIPMEDGQFAPVEEYIANIEIEREDDPEFFQLADTINGILTNPTYQPSGVFAYEDVDDGDWGFAFVSDKTHIVADHYDDYISFNVHIEREGQECFFIYHHKDEDEGWINGGVEIMLLIAEE